MAKKSMPRVKMANVHFVGPIYREGVTTICGERLFKNVPETTRADVTCQSCRALAKWIYQHRQENIDNA